MAESFKIQYGLEKPLLPDQHASLATKLQDALDRILYVDNGNGLLKPISTHVTVMGDTVFVGSDQTIKGFADWNCNAITQDQALHYAQQKIEDVVRNVRTPDHNAPLSPPLQPVQDRIDPAGATVRKK